MIDMRSRFLRVLSAGITAAVAVLVLLCVMLVHHGGEAGALAPAVHTVQPGGYAFAQRAASGSAHGRLVGPVRRVGVNWVPAVQ